MIKEKKGKKAQKNKEAILKYENDITKSLNILNTLLVNNIALGAGKADREAKVLAISKNWENLHKKVNNIYSNSNDSPINQINYNNYEIKETCNNNNNLVIEPKNWSCNIYPEVIEDDIIMNINTKRDIIN